MASLALGVVGAFIGSFFGPIGTSIGWALGSMLGSALDPVKVVGPKLSDLHLQGSSYGSPIPRLYGTARLGANVIWKTDLEPHEHKSGGKGGPETVTTTYSASYDAAICVGAKIMSKIWANGRLVYENGTGDVPVVFYDGNADQLPDPTEEAVVGAGLVPAYRGIARCVVTDQTLTDFGNALPQNNYLVSSGDRELNRAATWDVATSRRGVSYVDGVVTVAYWVTTGMIPGFHTSDPSYWRTSTYTEDGTLLDTVDVVKHFPEGILYLCFNEPTLSWNTPIGTDTGSRWYKDGVMIRDQMVDAGLSTGFYSVGNDFVYHKGNVYAVGGATSAYVIRWPAPDAVPDSVYDIHYLLKTGQPGGQFNIGVSNDGHIYVSGDGRLRKFDADLNLVKTWISGASPNLFPDGDAAPGSQRWMVCSDTMLYYTASGVHTYSLYRMTDELPWPLIASLSASNGVPLWNVGAGLCVVPDGILSVCEIGGPVTLASIVADICQRCGLTSDQYDVSDLIPVFVRGFVLDQTMTGRAAIEALMPVFFFDAVESDGKIKFVRRGHASLVTIPAAELAAHMDGEESPTPLQVVRAQDEELPAHITLNYINPDADYLTGSQQWRRMTGGSKIDSTVNVPVVLSDREAKAIVDAWGFNAWLERDKFSWSTSRAYAKYEPTDVVTVSGIDLRITNKTEGAGGVIKWEGRRAHIGVFAQSGGGAGGSGGVPTQTVPIAQTTDLLLLDIPYIPDPTAVPAFWAAMAGSARRSWKGATLERSVDGGATYSDIASATSPDTIGAASTALAMYWGGNTFDESNGVTVVIAPGGGELVSATRDAVINGVNEALLGGEIIQYRDAVLTAASTYRLTGLLRGRRGTEWAMQSHHVGESFVVLPTATAVGAPYADIALARDFKAVTAGRTLATATTVEFTNRGVILAPHFPVLLAAGINGDGDWIYQWVRRTRIGGRWLNFTDVPLGEASEQYAVTVWATTEYAVKVATLTCSVPTITITVAQQTAWYGSPQATPPPVSVAQVGIHGPGYDTLGNAPVVVSPPPPDGPPITPDVPLGDVQWHDDYRFAGSTHAESNFNWLQDNYSSSWAWAYMARSNGGLRSLLVSDLGDEANRIINTMMGMGSPYPPSGFMVPFASRVDPGPTLHAYRPLVDIPLPHPDDSST